MATDQRIYARIRQRLGRRGAALDRTDLDPHGLPEAVRAPDVPPNDAERAEEEELERDVLALHATYPVSDASLGPSQRRVLGPFVGAFRRAAVRVLRPVLEHQSGFNGTVARSVSNLRNRTLRHDELLRKGIGSLAPPVREQAKALAELERRISVLERERARQPAVALDELAFANRFRGDEAAIRERQRKYVDLFAGAEGTVLDLGCGRGEFLELLAAEGIAGRGVDTDPRMVEHTRRKGLSAELRDGFAYLEGVPPHSLGGIFAAQLIEHLDLSQVLSLLRLARRALAPGAPLLLETHNPQTLLTYPAYAVDPTHVRLYHSETVAWLLEQEGFVDVEIRLTDPTADGLDLSAAGERDPIAELLTAILHGHLTYAAVGRAAQA